MKNENITWSEDLVSYEKRCEILNQKGLIIWFTGLSGSGKSTIAINLQKKLVNEGLACYRLDGDNVRHGLNSDLGFEKEDRNENIRRIAEVSALFKDAGLITLVSFISPYEKMREFARSKVGKDDFVCVYVKADVKTCIKRDVKGLYEKALSGEISDFTGVSAPYEIPDKPEITVDTENKTVDDCVKKIYDYLKKHLNDKV